MQDGWLKSWLLQETRHRVPRLEGLEKLEAERAAAAGPSRLVRPESLGSTGTSDSHTLASEDFPAGELHSPLIFLDLQCSSLLKCQNSTYFHTALHLAPANAYCNA